MVSASDWDKRRDRVRIMGNRNIVETLVSDRNADMVSCPRCKHQFRAWLTVKKE